MIYPLLEFVSYTSLNNTSICAFLQVFMHAILYIFLTICLKNKEILHFRRAVKKPAFSYQHSAQITITKIK